MDFYYNEKNWGGFTFKQTLFIILYNTAKHLDNLLDNHPCFGGSILEWNIDKEEWSTLQNKM